MKTLFIAKGSPWENGYVESFNSRFRDEFLNLALFTGSRGCALGRRSLATRLQPPETPPFIRLPDPGGVRRPLLFFRWSLRPHSRSAAVT